jgi:hypothetical protein
MKKLKLSLQNFEGSEMLTRAQLKKVTGGDVGGSSICANEMEVCYTDGSGYQYTCFTVYEATEEKECCCRHDAGNQNCYQS